jgi:hypothetical protein
MDVTMDIGLVCLRHLIFLSIPANFYTSLLRYEAFKIYFGTKMCSKDSLRKEGEV